MEKSSTVKLTDVQQSQIAKDLGLPFDRIAIRVVYKQESAAQAKSGGRLAASVTDKTDAGQAWVVQGVQLVPQSTGQESAFQFDLEGVTGGSGGWSGDPSDRGA